MMEEGPRKVRAKVYRIPRSPLGRIAKSVRKEQSLVPFRFASIISSMVPTQSISTLLTSSVGVLHYTTSIHSRAFGYSHLQCVQIRIDYPYRYHLFVYNLRTVADEKAGLIVVPAVQSWLEHVQETFFVCIARSNSYART